MLCGLALNEGMTGIQVTPPPPLLLPKINFEANVIQLFRLSRTASKSHSWFLSMLPMQTGLKLSISLQRLLGTIVMWGSLWKKCQYSHQKKLWKEATTVSLTGK